MEGRPAYLQPRRNEEIDGPLRAGRPSVLPVVPNVRIQPLANFPGDQIYTAGATPQEFNLSPGVQLLNNLRGFRFVNVGAGVMADVNGGGTRAIFEKDAFDFVTVISIRLVVPAGVSVTLQQWAE